MPTLTDVPEIDQSELEDLVTLTIEAKSNLFVLGPAGGGKTEIAQQTTRKMGYQDYLVDLSVLEAPDFVGLPVIDRETMTTRYALPEFLPRDMKKKPAVLLFDEVDKGKDELQNALLEVSHLHSINNIPLNIQSCIFTGNLPDEGSFSKLLSHALCNRGALYKLKLNFENWRKWALTAEIDPTIIGFLNDQPSLLYQPPSSDDPTAYCHPSPRAWSFASRDLKASEKTSSHLKTLLVAGRVGKGAAARYKVWMEYYADLRPAINDLLYRNIAPTNLDGKSREQSIVFCIGVLSLAMEEFKKPNGDKNQAFTCINNAVSWMNHQPKEFQMGAFRAAIDPNVFCQNLFSDLKEFKQWFTRMHKVTQDFAKQNGG